jgi:tetratricopeptide (TPR) repeat protein
VTAGRARTRVAFAVLVLCCTPLLGSCVTLPPPPSLGEQITPANLDADEQALWKESRELQYKIRSSGLLFEDPDVDLHLYLAGVLERVTPSELQAAQLEPRVEVISNVNIDGYSFANGVIYLHTGLLARMKDENELAIVLSRELAHVVRRHALYARRLHRLSADSLAWIGVGSSMVEGGGQVMLLAQAASITSAVGFGHAQEVAADQAGLALLDRAGYAVAGVPAFYERNLEYLAEVHAQGVWGWTAFVPPPQVTGRIASLKSLIASHYADQTARRRPLLGPEAFRLEMHPVALRQAELERASGLFVSAEGTARLAIDSEPRDPRGWILLGRALEGQRTKRLPGRPVPSIREVRQAYQEALEHDPQNAEATRELGMTFYRATGTGRSAEDSRMALRHLRRYLKLAPEAGDRAYVTGYIEELQRALR